MSNLKKLWLKYNYYICIKGQLFHLDLFKKTCTKFKIMRSSYYQTDQRSL